MELSVSPPQRHRIFHSGFPHPVRGLAVDDCVRDVLVHYRWPTSVKWPRWRRCANHAIVDYDRCVRRLVYVTSLSSSSSAVSYSIICIIDYSRDTRIEKQRGQLFKIKYRILRYCNVNDIWLLLLLLLLLLIRTQGTTKENTLVNILTSHCIFQIK